MTILLDAPESVFDEFLMPSGWGIDLADVGLTATDLFCGAGGMSVAARRRGIRLVMAANHWATAIDVHQGHFPDAGHDLADITQVDPRRYPRTNILLASPECTNHSQARGVSRKKQDPTLWDLGDPSAERSRATMWDVGRFAEQMRYDVMLVENVWEATKWSGWHPWLDWMTRLGYEHKVLSINSMHHAVPQSRDRIYVVFWLKGIPMNLEREINAYCSRCDGPRVCRQSFKNKRTAGRYRQQWVWSCIVCGHTCEPRARGAIDIIDRTLPCPPIGDRPKPLVKNTRARVFHGVCKHWLLPIITAGAGNTYETTPGNRSHPVTEPLPVQQATATHALAVPPLIVKNNGDLSEAKYRAFPATDPLGAMTATPAQYYVDPPDLIMANTTNNVPTSVDDPMSTVVAGTQRHALIVNMRGTSDGQLAGSARPADDSLSTVSAGGRHHGLLMRNNGGADPAAVMTTPLSEPARTMTTAGHQSLLMPYYGTSQAQPVDRPTPTVTTKDRCGLIDIDDLIATGAIDVDAIVDSCGFRMLEPHEVAAAMAFPTVELVGHDYIPRDLPKKHQVRLAGNAVTPPVIEWILGRIVEALS